MVRRGGNISVDLYLFVLLHKTKFMNKIKFEGCQVGDNSAKSIKRGHKNIIRSRNLVAVWPPPKVAEKGPEKRCL